VKAAYSEEKYDKSDWALTGKKGREQHIVRSLYLSEILIDHNVKLQKKYKQIQADIVKYKEYYTEDCDILIVAFGTMARCALSGLNECRKEGIKAGLFVPQTLWPYPSQRLQEIAEKPAKILVAEMNAGQMIEDVQLALNGSKKCECLNKLGGDIPKTTEVTAKLRAMAGDL
jgi:2-oxoglutarate ferredoxin oxidoreductase subunit alpha